MVGALDAELHQLLENAYAEPTGEDPISIAASHQDETLRIVAIDGVNYLLGDFGGVKRIFQQLESEAAKLVVADITLAAAISAGDFHFYHELVDWLEQITADGDSPGAAALAELQLAVWQAGAIKPDAVAPWIKSGDFSALHPKMRLVACLRRAEYFLGVQDYPMLLATTQTAIALLDPKDAPNQWATEIFLRIRCAIAYQHLGQLADARAVLAEAMDLSLPWKFITPFAETLHKLGGLTEALLTEKYPDLLKPVGTLFRELIPGWTALKNDADRARLVKKLTPRELEIAYCAARGETAQEIAKKYHLSVGTVRNIIQSIYDKFLITSHPPRKELAKIML